MYDELASWWPLISSPDDYAEEAAFYRRALIGACDREPKSLIEIGSGGGNNALHMKAHFDEVVLVEPSAGMRAVSEKLNPDCRHLEGDMRTLRLGRQFDCVFLHDAICYMTSEEDLRHALETAFLHCRPGGSALFAPDHVAENFREDVDDGGHDATGDGDGRALRYLCWSWDPDPTDTTCVADYAYLLREADGSMRVVHDRHVEGLFPRDLWRRLLREVGFEVEVLPFDHSEIEPGSYELFVCRRPVES